MNRNSLFVVKTALAAFSGQLEKTAVLDPGTGEIVKMPSPGLARRQQARRERRKARLEMTGPLKSVFARQLEGKMERKKQIQTGRAAVQRLRTSFQPPPKTRRQATLEGWAKARKAPGTWVQQKLPGIHLPPPSQAWDGSAYFSS